MKKILILTIFLFAIKAKAQYTPLNLDTSCIWLHDFYHYDGLGSNPPNICNGRTVSYVEKDTIINSKLYFKIKTYVYKLISLDLDCMNQFPTENGNNICFIREDTTGKKVYALDVLGTDIVVLDFTLQLGDTFKNIQYLPLIVDSLNFNMHNGVSRKTWWGTNNFAWFGASYKQIDGIGGTYNFPPRGFGEWGVPHYMLLSYAKNGNILYGNTNYPVIKYPVVPIQWSVAINDSKKTTFNYTLTNNTLQIKNPLQQHLQINIYNYIGQKIFTTNCKTDNYNLPLQNILNNTMYIIEIKSKNGKLVDKFIAK